MLKRNKKNLTVVFISIVAFLSLFFNFLLCINPDFTLSVRKFFFNHLESSTGIPRRVFTEERLHNLEMVNCKTSDLVFIGTSLTEKGEWNEIIDNCRIKNRGISGVTSIEILRNLSHILKCDPNKIFLEVGTNDIAYGIDKKEIINNILNIITTIKIKYPLTKIYFISIPPTRSHQNRPNNIIREINEQMQIELTKINVSYLDLYTKLADDNGDLKKIYTLDGLHLLGNGYKIWADLISCYL